MTRNGKEDPGAKTVGKSGQFLHQIYWKEVNADLC